jgi:hypothetical protein
MSVTRAKVVKPLALACTSKGGVTNVASKAPASSPWARCCTPAL